MALTATQQWYADALADPRWHRRRLQILERDNSTCCRCGYAPGDPFEPQLKMHVHHLRYFRGRLPWEYRDCDLETLCALCHQLDHCKHGSVLEHEPAEFVGDVCDRVVSKILAGMEA